VEPTTEHVVVELGGTVVADTRRALRVLVPTAGSSFCEFKGTAAYLDVVVGAQRAARAAWYYPDPTIPYVALLDHVALYPAPFDRVTVNGEVVIPQEGGFYGGWITSRVVGPFRGGPGSQGW